MNRAVRPDARLPGEESKTVLPGKDQAVVVYCLQKQNMTVTLFSRGQSEPVVELALGTEARSFSLGEFVHFWLTMIEVGLKRDIAGLESQEVLRLGEKRLR
jgi:hypothetical protein